MLATFRAHAKGWIAWVFVILVTVPFAFWGVGQYRSLITTNYVAKVNGQKIMPSQLQKAYEQAYQQRQAALGGKFNPTPKQELALKKATLRQLVNRTLLSQQARRNHLVVSAKDVRDQIEQIPAFQSNGHFDFQRYRTVLANNGMSVSQFEAQVKSGLILQTLENGIGNTIFMTPYEIKAVVGLLKQQRKVAWFLLPLKRFAPKASPDAATIKGYYRAHQKRYSTPTTVAIAYVRLNRKALEKRVNVTDAALRAYYDTHQNRYGTPPARKAAEILIKPKGKKPAAWKKAQANAKSLLAKIRASAKPEKTFAALARKESDDPVSRRNGGSIGYVGRGQMSHNVDQALFAIKTAGGTAGPLRTKRGWVLLQLLGKRPGAMKPYAAVKKQVTQDYQASRAKAMYFKLGRQLANLAYEHSSSLDAVAKALNLKVQRISGVTRQSGTGIAEHAKVRKAAFSNVVMKQQQNSTPIKLGNEDAVVLRVSNVTPSKVKPLADVRADVIEAVQHKRALAAAKKAAAKALAALRTGKSIKDVAKTNSVALNGPKLISRNASGLPPTLAQSVFELAPRGQNKPRFAAVSLPKGDEAVYALMGVMSGQVSTLSKMERQAYAGQLGQLYATQASQDYTAWLRANSKIKIVQSNIQ